MSDDLQERTRRYYSSDVVDRWIDQVYSDDDPDRFPFGAARRLIVRAAVQRYCGGGGFAYDLGCGGGQLTVLLTSLGFDVRAIDFSQRMLDRAARLVAELAPARQVEFAHIDVLNDDPAAGRDPADLVIAMGFLEYCPDPAVLFAKVRTCLREGGVAVIEFRNRLLNVFTGNRHTVLESERGEVARLVAEVQRRWAAAPPTAEDIDAALRRWSTVRVEEGSPWKPAVEPFPGDRLQHTFEEIQQLASAAGFDILEFLALHPHPFPPAVEAAAPRAYNAIAWQLQQEPRNPIVLMSSSSAAAVLRAC